MALVGPTGAGKSTTLSLLHRMWDAQSGVIRIDGVDHRDIKLDSLRRNIGVVFQDFLLPRGEWVVNGEKVDPSAIRDTALLSIEGELDDIAGLGQTEAAQALCTGITADRREHFIVEGAGHYGIFSGRRWREVVYPKVRDFFAAHAEAPAAKATKKKSNVTPLRRKAG